MVATTPSATPPRPRRRWVADWMRGGAGRSGRRPSAELRLLWRLSLSALNEAPRFRAPGMVPHACRFIPPFVLSLSKNAPEGAHFSLGRPC